MRTPKILFLIRALDVGGAQRQLVELARGLKRNGWSVTVATFYPHGALVEPLIESGVAVACLAKRGRWDVAGFASRLVKLVYELQPDVVHGYMDTSNILLALLRPFSRTRRIVWGVAAPLRHAGPYGWLERLELRLGSILSHSADLIISNSEAARERHAAHGYAADRMVVIPNGIDVEHFRPDARARSQVRAEWQIDSGVKLVGLVGRLDPLKDHACFLQAASDLAARRCDVRFICIGDGPLGEKTELVHLAARLGLTERLIWAGERSDMWRMYNALDLLVCASLSEGLPNAILEAMATGVPCVVTDVGDCAQAVRGLGWVCQPGDSGLLAATISRALSAAPCDAEALRQRVCTMYSAHLLVTRTSDALSRLMAGVPSVSALN